MNSYLHRIALALLLAVSVTASSRADEAQDIIDSYIKATGGENAHRSVKTRVTKGTLTMGPITGEMTIYQKEPNLFRTDIKLGPVGEQQMGYDGKRGWQKTLGQLTDMPPKLLDQHLRDMSMLRELEIDKHFTAKKVVAGETVNGSETVGIELTQNDGGKQTWYFDKQSHFLVRVKSVAWDPQQGDMATDTTMKDYKEFDGIKLPTISSTKLPFGALEMKFTAVEHNTDLPLKTFQP